MSADCRANAKTRANFNKRRNTPRGGAQYVDGVPIDGNKSHHHRSHMVQAESDSDDYPEDYPFKDTRPDEFFNDLNLWDPVQED